MYFCCLFLSSFVCSTISNRLQSMSSLLSSPHFFTPQTPPVQMYPEALEAITNLSRLAKEKTGVDLSSGDKPSMKMMMMFSNDVRSSPLRIPPVLFSFPSSSARSWIMTTLRSETGGFEYFPLSLSYVQRDETLY